MTSEMFFCCCFRYILSIGSAQIEFVPHSLKLKGEDPTWRAFGGQRNVDDIDVWCERFVNVALLLDAAKHVALNRSAGVDWHLYSSSVALCNGEWQDGGFFCLR